MKHNLPVIFPDILLPQGISLTEWAVVACDQFTSNPEYWNTLAKMCEGKVGTLHIILPEIYLSADNSSRAAQINATMRQYLDGGILQKHESCAILVKRRTCYGRERTGLVLAVDLEAYDFDPTRRALIRATEGVIAERIPPRVQIRKDAPLELPHVMLLLDDPNDTVIRPLERECNNQTPLYDFELNMNGGHVTGYKITDSERVLGALERLLSQQDEDKILFAVGDGNHSLACAKACWEQIKAGLSDDEAIAHPARFALAEVVNIYDSGIIFEPIHRAVFGADKAEFLRNLPALPDGSIEAVKTAQQYVTDYIATHPAATVDYVHGRAELERLDSEGAAVIALPPICKSELFPYVVQKGLLPRKAFSMGEGEEKRYYIEARQIQKELSIK